MWPLIKDAINCSILLQLWKRLAESLLRKGTHIALTFGALHTARDAVWIAPVPPLFLCEVQAEKQKFCKQKYIYKMFMACRTKCVGRHFIGSVKLSDKTPPTLFKTSHRLEVLFWEVKDNTHIIQSLAISFCMRRVELLRKTVKYPITRLLFPIR